MLVFVHANNSYSSYAHIVSVVSNSPVIQFFFAEHNAQCFNHNIYVLRRPRKTRVDLMTNLLTLSVELSLRCPYSTAKLKLGDLTQPIIKQAYKFQIP